MGSICSKRKGSESSSVQTENGSNKRGSAEQIENHSQSSKNPLPSHSDGGKGGSSSGGPERSSVTEATPSTVLAQTPEPSSAPKDPPRTRIIRDAAEPSSVSGDSVSLSSPTMMNPPGGTDLPFPSKLPIEIHKQPENIRNLLIGRSQKVKPIMKSHKITLYICVADSQDFRLEKGHLHTEVYPDLRAYASSKGYELHITDLHWKTDLEMKQDHDFPELCLGELKRQEEVSHVIPVLFLSDSLGAPLLPKTMEQQDFELSLSNVTDPRGRELLDTWYKLDTHAQPPCYRLSPIVEHIPSIDSAKPNEKTGAIQQWQGIVEELMDTLIRVLPTELRDTYLTTVIEQEIHNSIFMSRDVGKRSIWVQRLFTGKDVESVDTLSQLDIEKNRRLESLQSQLKNLLIPERILKFSTKWRDGGLSSSDYDHRKYLLEVSNQLSILLRSAIDALIDEESNKGKWKSCFGITGCLVSEVMEHTAFSQQGAKCCLSFENIINDIKIFVSNETPSGNHPLVVYGPGGCGKTCFISRLIQQASTWNVESAIVYRFIGLTPESRSLVQILRTINSQISFLLYGRNYWIPHNPHCYLRELYKIASTPLSLVIIIDGLDQLDERDLPVLDWLSQPLPPKVKLIISCLEESPVFQLIKSKIQHQKAFIQMPSLSLLSAESMLTASILQYSHSIDSEVQKRLSSCLSQSVLPLYIKILAWVTAVDRNGVLDISNVSTLKDTGSLLFDYLDIILDKRKVGIALGYLCISRHGLADSELLDLLAHSYHFSSKITFVDWAPASLFLAQLCQFLGPFLEWGISDKSFIVRWRDSAMAQLAKGRYVIPETETKLRQTLLGYFSGEWKDARNGRFIEWKSGYNLRRAVEEIPFQAYHLNGSIATSHLSNLEWLLTKIQNSTVFNILEDLDLEQNPTEDLILLTQCLELSASALSNDPSQFQSQLYDRLLPIFNDTTMDWSMKCPFMKNVFESAKCLGTPGFVPLNNFIYSPLNYKDLIPSPISSDTTPTFCSIDAGEIFFNEVYRMKSSNQFVVTLSTAKEEVIVWDAYSEASVRTLKGVHNPVSLKVIDEHRCVILCGRELITYNLDNGSLTTKLKGVMNQKMPYYGLHDENHIVAISRNRMYVNLMNLDSGDCITAFKVGEDRFLNSLLVSDNGKLLVCGDETQKPFPLLVWDLPSRKLLYDLRIPHHEFVTSLAAITKEGHFVCCVCREVDDPGPNFIVVYDLQSGTLFKKWKPGCSTQAIAISSQGGCVINALEDNRIIVWDLVTGASQWSLERHLAPPDVLKLDNRGSRCLSYDSTGRDRSICLWDVNNGNLLAMFTPDIPFTACEVLNDGDGIVLGLKGRHEIATLTVRNGSSSIGQRVKEKYGSEEYHGKVTTLKS